MSDTAIEELYRQTFSDRLVTPEESDDLIDTLQSLQQIQDNAASPPPPPVTPDKFVWLRAAAFRIACEYLVQEGDVNSDGEEFEDPREENLKLLKSINALVHSLETTCLLPSLPEEGGEEFSEDAVEALFKSLYETEEEWDGPEITMEESRDLMKFLTGEATRPPLEKLVWLRTAAFRIGSEYLDENNNKERNVALLRSINVVVHTVENACMITRPYELQLPESIIPTLDTDFQTAAQTLWKLDSNRLQPNKDYTIDVQNNKHPCHKEDCASDPLFTHVDPAVFDSRPTFRAFRSLLDNYSRHCGEDEEVTEEELKENQHFLNVIMETGPMKYCHRFCLAKEATYGGEPIPEDEDGFKEILNSIWLELYSRSGGELDSSGFEHVFVGEVKHDKISGFHNWIQFYLEEKKGNIDYRGYIKPRSRDDSMAETNGDDHVLTLQFAWDGVEKFVGTSFIGVSPEFELALYTMAFLTMEGEDSEISLDVGGEVFDLKVKCYMYNDGRNVGSCYVEALAHYEE
ncbi:hypothetical protein ACHAXS_006552 [Conticribra weissflogii]